MKSVEQKLLKEPQELLREQFTKGIQKTWYKSNDPEKVNELRELLNLPNRPEKLAAKQYDAQITTKLSQIDFSPLDAGTTLGFHNAQAMLVLNIAGIGFTAAPDVETAGEDADFFSNV